jgi:putative ABC transport system permease protein
MSSLLQDLRYGLRGLRNQPGFAGLAILTLALGIGASTTIFSVIYGVLLNPFPYKNPERIVGVYIHDSARPDPGGRVALQLDEFLQYRDQSHVFSEAMGSGNEDVLYENGEGTERFNGAYMTANTFRFLGMSALIGRTFTEDDVKAGAPRVFVMSYPLWDKRFNRDPSILGKNFILNNVPMTLVGIMPVRFTKRGADVWWGVSLDRADHENAQRYFILQARLKRGATIRDAETDLGVVAHRIAQTHPKDYPKQFTIDVETYIDSIIGQFRKTLYTLAAAVAMLLLIACSNVANMLLARATAREKEMAIRSALGASRFRLVSQLLAESLLLAVFGASLGCLFAYAGIKGLVTLIPVGLIPQEAVILLNTEVLLFSLGVAVGTAVLFGLAPALQTAKRDIVEPLKDSGKGVSGGFRHGKLRNALVVFEVAMSLVLLAGAGLLMRSFIALQTVDLGFNPDNILVARLPLPRGQYTTAAQKTQFFQTLLGRIQALPGVVAATETTTLPPYGGIRSDIEIPGKTSTETSSAIYQLCSEGYFPTLRLRVLRGRTLTATEVAAARKVAVVNLTLSRKYFGAENPIGQRIRVRQLETARDPVKDAVFEIVGVTADEKNQGLQDPPLPEMFVPYTITGDFERGILVRTAGDPNQLLNPVRKQVWAVDRRVALTLTGSLNDFISQFTYAEPRLSLVLFGVFAAVGMILVAIGVYSVIAYTVSRQTHEIGIRMALGAGRGDVVRMVFRMGFKLLLLGIAIGLLASAAVTRVLAHQLWNVSPHDPLTLASVVILVIAIGVAACYFPARRATRVNPIDALRYE